MNYRKYVSKDLDMPLSLPLIYIISCDVRNLNAFKGGILNYRKYVSKDPPKKGV